ncbi:MAG: HD-GYP domain-containing protein [Gemmatimonadaceae bacterium]
MAVGAAIALTAFFALTSVPTIAEWKAAGFFAAFGVVASSLAYRTSGATLGSIGFLPFLSAALLTPNAAALVSVLLATAIGELIVRRDAVKAIFNTSQHVFAVAVGISAYLALGGSSLLTSSPRFWPFLSLVVGYFVLNKLAVSTVVAASGGATTRAHWTKSMRGSLVYDLLAFPLILAFALAYARYGPGVSALLALPMLGVRQLYHNNFALQKINEELLQLMVASIEARDPYTSGHSQRVSRYARNIARVAGLSGRATDRTAIAALLHDVGKIHEEFAAILRKPGRLTDAEFEIMKTHPARSAALVGKVSQFADLVRAVRAHHEAWDGRGYPDRLSGSSIPVIARIIAFADTIDAMTTSRPYRAALSVEEVRAEIGRERGRQFDPEICDRLLTVPAWNELSAEIASATAEYPETLGWVGAHDDGRTGEYFVATPVN